MIKERAAVCVRRGRRARFHGPKFKILRRLWKNGAEQFLRQAKIHGQGGAKDVAIVTVTVTYDRLFPMANLIGLPEQVTVAANTVLANQPYAEQGTYAAAQTRNCDD